MDSGERRGPTLRILTISDKVEPVLYGPYIRERIGKADLILACGDLPYDYLDYIASMLDASLYYVHGNHDEEIRPRPNDSAESAAGPRPTFSWAVNLHRRGKHHQGLLLAGLEGCRQYAPGALFQYTEAQVRWQVAALSLSLLLNKVRYGRYLDILITHAPPHGIHDGQDLPHRGFVAYLELLRRFRPTLMIHGHHHVYVRRETTESDYMGTRVINTYGYRILELAPAEGGKGWALLRSGR